MATETPTLTDFLLARIAEDEARATQYHRLLCMRIACDAEGCIWGEDEEDAMERERVCTCGYATRVLAECEAKRRIVERHSRHLGHEPTPHVVPELKWREGCETLRLLALPYADHPDYRPEWTPEATR